MNGYSSGFSEEDSAIYNALLDSDNSLLQAYALQFDRTGAMPYLEYNETSPSGGDSRAEKGIRKLFRKEFGQEMADAIPINLQMAYVRNDADPNIEYLRDGIDYFREENPDIFDIRDFGVNSFIGEDGTPQIDLMPLDQMGNLNALGTERQWNQMPLYGTLTGENNALSGSDPTGVDNSLSNPDFKNVNNLNVKDFRTGKIMDSNMWVRDENNTLVRQPGQGTYTDEYYENQDYEQALVDAGFNNNLRNNQEYTDSFFQQNPDLVKENWSNSMSKPNMRGMFGNNQMSQGDTSRMVGSGFGQGASSGGMGQVTFDTPEFNQSRNPTTQTAPEQPMSTAEWVAQGGYADLGIPAGGFGSANPMAGGGGNLYQDEIVGQSGLSQTLGPQENTPVVQNEVVPSQIDPLSQDMDAIPYQHPAQYQYAVADSVAPHLGMDYRARMMDNIINRDMHTAGQLDLYGQEQQNLLNQTFDDQYINDRLYAMDNIAEGGRNSAVSNMNASQQGANTSYAGNVSDASGERDLTTAAANQHIGGAADEFGNTVTGAAGTFDQSVGANAGQFNQNLDNVGDRFAGGMQDTAANFNQDMSQAGQQFAVDSTGGASQYNQNLGNIADANMGGQQALYGQYLNQGNNATDLMNRMSQGGYAQEAFDRQWDSRADDVEARMNAMGLGRSGAAIEGLSEAYADQVADFTNQGWERDAQMAQMAGQMGMQSAGAMSNALNNESSMRMAGAGAMNDAAQRAAGANFDAGVQGAQASMQAGQAGLQGQMNMNAQGAEAMFNMGNAGAQAQMDAANQAGQAGFQTGMQQGANAYQAGMMNAQDQMMAGRDMYGADLQNINRQYDLDRDLTGQYATNADSYYADLYNNQQAGGQAAMNLNAQILQNEINRGQQYYNSLSQFDAETSRANANAALEDASRRINNIHQNQNVVNDIYGNAAQNYAQMSSGLYDLGNNMMITGLTSGANAYMRGNPGQYGQPGGRGPNSDPARNPWSY